MPDTFAIHKEEMIIKYTDAKCLAIEESLDGGTIDGISGDVTSQYDEAYCTRKGLLHGLWMPCNTLVCEDKDLLEYTLHKTCGNFRFKVLTQSAIYFPIKTPSILSNVVLN